MLPCLPAFNQYNREMYKPTLKRTQPTNNYTQTNSIIPETTNHHPEKVIPALSPSTPMIPNKMLEAPEINKKDKQHIVTPLVVQSHKYPPKVLERLENQEEGQREKSRGVGGYREINWFFQGKVLSLWITDKEEAVELAVEQDINAVAMGELKAEYLPFKLRNRYIIAIGCLNIVTLYSLNNFALQAFPVEAKYLIQYSLQIEKIKFVSQSKIVIVSNTGYLKIIEFDQNERVKAMEVPFYKQIIPVTVHQQTVTVEQMLCTPSKIFILMTQYATKGWFRQTVEGLLSGKPADPIRRRRFIQVYSIRDKIQKKEQLYESQLMNRVQNYLPAYRKDLAIKSIFIDYKHDKEGELGIVTSCGCFITIRNHTFLGRQPLFAPNLTQLGECQFITLTQLQLIQLNNEDNNTKVVCSLGYQNLTLLEDSLLWIGDDRIDGVLSSSLIGELYQKNQYQSQNMIQKKQEWGMFGLGNYFTIRQLPIRQMVTLFFYIKNSISNEYSGMHYKEEQFQACLNKYIKMLGPHRFLKYLVEVVISQERFITVNPFFLELIENELKEEKPKEMKDWKHTVSPNIKKQEIFINQHIIQHIWATILEIQNKEVGTTSNKFANLYDSSVYWLTMQDIYYSLISPLFTLNPEDFRKNKLLIEDVQQALKSMEAFFQQKHDLQAVVRGSYSSRKNTKEAVSSLDHTEASLEDNEVSWLPQAVRRSIATKTLNDNYLMLQAKIEAAFRATAILMTIFYNLQDYIECKEGTQMKLYGQLFNTAFKEVLSSRETQKLIKKLLIDKLEINHLADIDLGLPTFDLATDLKYLRCRQKLKLEQRAKDELDLEEIACSISSDYFEDIDSIFGNRQDLKLKMVGLYQERMLNLRDNLVKSNTLQERHLINQNCFPEDQEEILKTKRNHIDRELDLVIEEQKKCISRTIFNHADSKKNAQGSLSPVIDQVIIYVSTKPYLFLYTEQELRAASLIRQLCQLERIKPTKMPSTVFSSSVKIKPQYIKRDLFPPFKPY